MKPKLTSREYGLLNRYRNQVVQTVRAHLHIGPFDRAKELDRIAEYSNGTVLQICYAISKLPFVAPPNQRSQRGRKK
jgi:hypothetical protein